MIKLVVFDLDNTLVPVTVKKPTKKVSDLFEDLKRKGFKLIIVSNSPKKRVAPFKDYLCTDSAYFSFKPLKRKYNKILKKKDCFKHPIENGLKSKVRSLIIKANSYLFYNYLVR